MGDGRIFLKNRRASSFNKDLSNEPNYGRINLFNYLLLFFGGLQSAGQSFVYVGHLWGNV